MSVTFNGCSHLVTDPTLDGSTTIPSADKRNHHKLVQTVPCGKSYLGYILFSDLHLVVT
jgi:hypothetical protein